MFKVSLKVLGLMAVMALFAFLSVTGCNTAINTPKSSSSSATSLVLVNDLTVQDFETNTNSLMNCNHWGTGSAIGIDSITVCHGSNSFRHTTTDGPWVGFGLTNFTSGNTNTIDLKPSGSAADRLVIWVHASSTNGTHGTDPGTNTIEFQIADNSNFPIGTELKIWSDKFVNPVALTNDTWVKLEVLFSEMTNSSGTALDIHNVKRFQFSNYWEGTYYYDWIYSGHYTNL